MRQLAHEREQPVERIWEPWEGETPGSHHAFEHYRDLGSERSLPAAYEAHQIQCMRRQRGKLAARPPGEWTKACGLHQWARRADAWDMWVNRRRQYADEDTVVENRRTALRVGTAALDLATQTLVRWLTVYAMDPAISLPPSVAVQLARLGTALGASRETLTDETYKSWLEELDKLAGQTERKDAAMDRSG
jgi:hypothetical protein